MADECKELLRNIREDVLMNRTELKSSIEASETRILLKIEDLQQRINKLEHENNSLSNKIESLERASKKNNILVFGLKETYQSPKEICNKLKELLQVEICISDLNNAYSIKHLQNTVKLELVSHLKKVEILKNAKKLKNTGIYIAQDLTYIQREENRLLKKHLKKARENPTDKSYIRQNKLYVNNKCYTIDELEQLDSSYLEEERKVSSAPPTPSIRKYTEQNKEEQEQGKGDRQEEQEREEEQKEEAGPSIVVQDGKQIGRTGVNNTPKTSVSKKFNHKYQAPHLASRKLRSGSQSSQN